MKGYIIILGNSSIRDINRGCVALTISTLYLLDELLSRSNVPYKIYLSNSGLTGNGSVDVQILDKHINVSYFDLTYDNGMFKRLKKILKQLLDGSIVHNYRIMKSADFIMDIGYGDSFSDIYGIDRFNKIDIIHKISSKLRIPYCLLPQTIGPFSDKFVESSAARSLRGASLIMPRDTKSLLCAKGLLDAAEVEEYIDVAFFLPYEKCVINNGAINVGIGISDLLWRGGYSGKNEFGLLLDYRELVRSIIDHLLSIDGVVVHLVPHVLSGDRFSESDYSVSYDLWRGLNNPRVVLSPYFLGPIEAKSYISGLDLFIGARMHATIAAFSSGVPVIPMSYSRKFSGLFCETLNYPFVIDMKHDDISSSCDLIDRVLSEIDRVKSSIIDTNNTVVLARKELILNHIKSFLKMNS